MKYFLRLITLPILLLLFAIARIRDGVIFGYYHMRYGSEVLVYKEKFNPLTIRDSLDKILNSEIEVLDKRLNNE
jgi:hypothetical protein